MRTPHPSERRSGRRGWLISSALVANCCGLMPYSLLLLGIAFGGDYDPWPFAWWGVIALVTSVMTSGVLLIHWLHRLPLILATAMGQAAVWTFAGVQLFWLFGKDFADALLYLFVTPAALIPPLSGAALWRLRSPLPTLGGCLQCGYDLAGLSATVCPECGAATPTATGQLPAKS